MLNLATRSKLYLRRFKLYIWLATAWRLLRRVGPELEFVRLSSLVKLIQNSPDFPSSAGSFGQWLSLSIKGFNETIPSLVELSKLDASREQISILQLDEHFPPNHKSLQLREIFDQCGSDKGNPHHYDQIYSMILARLPNDKLSILEVGLGTNNVDIPSNMGTTGRPGASLRAWATYCPNAEVVGVDIDRRVLFSEERIKTYQLDQTSSQSWARLKSLIDIELFDLVIDDGLHSPVANLRTFIEVSPLIRKNGYLVIEDIPERAISVWMLVSQLVSFQWDLRIVKTPMCFAAVLRKL